MENQKGQNNNSDPNTLSTSMTIQAASDMERGSNRRRQNRQAAPDDGMQKIAGDTSSFPSGPPPQYSSRLKLFNFGVRMGSGAFSLVWPTANTYLLK